MLVVVIIIIVIIFAVLKALAKAGDNIQVNEIKKGAQQQLIEVDSIIKTQNITVSKDLTYYLIDNLPSFRIIVDNTKRILHIFGMDKNNVSIPFDKLLGCEVFQDQQAVGGIGRAIAGGLIAGGAGAIVGTLTGGKINSMRLVIYQDDLKTPQIPLVLLGEGIGNPQYATAFANEMLATFKVLLKQKEDIAKQANNETAKQTELNSNIEAIKKYKELLDMGIITNEEFENKKKELLNISSGV